MSFSASPDGGLWNNQRVTPYQQKSTSTVTEIVMVAGGLNHHTASHLTGRAFLLNFLQCSKSAISNLSFALISASYRANFHSLCKLGRINGLGLNHLRNHK
ncbi:TPA: hypothetical protein JZG68_004784 [Escherichia coli]|nr:hypothetical protein [Escherichia coli]